MKHNLKRIFDVRFPVASFSKSGEVSTTQGYLQLFFLFLDPESDFEGIPSLVLDELGENMHVALHSRDNELQYQRQLVESLLPFLLPSSALGSRYVCGHISFLECSI